jgi:hypothetical protein
MPGLNMATCYMCDGPATGREHIPAQCIFPKDKQYRKNLITVPSCDAHNLAKTKEDEYVKFILTFAGGGNDQASGMIPGVLRSFDHRPHLVEYFMPGLRPVQVAGNETGQFTLDSSRFENWLKSIVRGLYFHENGEKLLCEISGIHWGRVCSENFSINAVLAQLPPAKYLGANPKVFQYAFDNSKSGKTSMCRLCFYEGHSICIRWKNLNVPTNAPTL